MTRIRIVADDYGISPSVNAAIRDLIASGRINATSVMVAAPSFDREQARQLAGVSQRAALGLHLTLTAPFKPLSSTYAPTQDGAFLSLGRTAVAAIIGQIGAQNLEREIGAQIDAFTAAFGRPPDFIDGHQHVHLFPRIGTGLLAVMKRKAPGAWVRQCGRATGAVSFAARKAVFLDVLSQRFRARAAAAGVITNPAFAGAYDFGSGSDFATLFASFLDRLPDGSVVMCHPGEVDAELVRLDPLTAQREREYAYFKSDAFPALLAARGLALI